MSTNLRSHPVSFPVEDDEICVLFRHVAADAFAVDLVTHLRESVSARFVTAQTNLRKMLGDRAAWCEHHDK